MIVAAIKGLMCWHNRRVSCYLQSNDYIQPKLILDFDFEHRMFEVCFTSLDGICWTSCPPFCMQQRHGPCVLKMSGSSRAFTWNVSVRYSASDGCIASVMSKLQTILVSLQSWITNHHIRHHNSIFGHIVRMSCTVPVHRALCCQVDLSLGCFPDRSWKYRPSRPLKC